MIRLGLCDDELWVHEQVQEYLCKHDFGTQIELVCFTNGPQLIEYEGDLPILLLDICMPELDGIAVGRIIKDKPEIGKIIMLTSAVERFEEAFEIEAYRFLSKPIVEEKFVKAMQDAIGTLIGNEYIEVFSGKIKYSFPQKEISYIGKMSSSTEVIIQKNVFHSPKTLEEWYKQLDHRLFLQVHKSYIVNLSKIDRIEDKIYLKNGEIVPVAKRRRSELLKCYMQYDLRYR